MRLHQFLTAMFILIGTFVWAGETSQACGCIPAMTEAELAPYKAKAERGDAQAAGTVWVEYALNGAPASPQQLRYWRSKAIRLADHYTINYLADDWLSKIGRSRNPEHRRLYADTAALLLNHAWHRRSLLKRGDQNNGWDEQLWNVRSLRTAVGVRALLRDGIATWEVRANRGDATAAHHLAVYYGCFCGSRDKDRSNQWARRAVELGDPDFASARGPDEIRRALQPGAPVYQIPNSWMRAVLLRKLNAQVGRHTGA